jgi:hypothetical protein
VGLDADCLARWSSARAIQLTNPDDATQTSVNSARLLAAVADVQGDFRAFSGMNYDESQQEMVAFGVQGVEIYLRRYQGRAEADELESWRKSLAQLMAQVAWVPPTGTSQLVPSTDVEIRGSPARPDADDRFYVDYRPTQSGMGFGTGGTYPND